MWMIGTRSDMAPAVKKRRSSAEALTRRSSEKLTDTIDLRRVGDDRKEEREEKGKEKRRGEESQRSCRTAGLNRRIQTHSTKLSDTVRGQQRRKTLDTALRLVGSVLCLRLATVRS